MWELDHKEGWAPKNWCFQTVVLEKTLESPVDCKVIKSVNPIGNKSWILTGRSDAEAEAPIICSPDAKSQLTGKDPDAREDWGQDEKRVIEDEMVEWHHWLNGHEFEQTLGDSEGQGSLVCCSPWGRKESTRLSDWTTYIHPLLPSLPSLALSHLSRSSQSTRLGSLCYTATSHQLSILHPIVHICWCYFLPSSHPLPLPLCPQVHSLNLCLCSLIRFLNKYLTVCKVNIQRDRETYRKK